MDDESMYISPAELQKLSPADQRELQTFVKNEEQKAQVQKSIHELTETCFRKCITGTISSGKLASKEESCMTNCVERFMDSNLAVLRHLEMMRSQQ